MGKEELDALCITLHMAVVLGDLDPDEALKEIKKAKEEYDNENK